MNNILEVVILFFKATVGMIIVMEQKLIPVIIAICTVYGMILLFFGIHLLKLTSSRSTDIVKLFVYMPLINT
jgi:hypothetical protein